MPQLLSIKQAVNDASMEVGITQTAAEQILSSRDEDIVQMASLLNAVADELLLDEPYRDILGDGNWLVSEDGSTYRSRCVAGVAVDTDRILFDGRLCIDGLKYRFLKAKGLEFGEEMRDFLNRLNKIAVRQNQRVLDLDNAEGRVL